MIMSLIGPGDKTNALLVLSKLLQYSGDICMMVFDDKVKELVEVDEDGDKTIGNVSIIDEMSLAIKFASDIYDTEYKDVLVVEHKEGYDLIKSDLYINFGLTEEQLKELGIQQETVINIIAANEKGNMKGIKLGSMKDVEDWYTKCINDKCLYGFKAGTTTKKFIKALEQYLNIPFKSMVSILNKGVM